MMARILAAVAGTALVASLTGCTNAAPTPAPSAGLLATVWHVHDAAGAGDSTYLLFGAGGLRVQLAAGSLLASWTTQGAAMLVHPAGEPPTSQPAARTVTAWLRDVAGFGRVGSGWVLTDAQGGTLATLRNDGPPPASRYVLMTPDPVTASDRAAIADAVAGPGVRTTPAAAALSGRWGVPGLDPAGAELTVTAGGVWTVTGDCREGLSDGSSGILRLEPRGFVLVLTDPRGAPACRSTAPPPPADAAALSDFDRACSVLLSGDHLTLFDKAGKRLGTLTRLG